MAPRRNRPKGSKPRDEDEPFSVDVVLPGPPGWQVRSITAERALKRYVCPGCNQALTPGTPHVVAWRTGAEDDRRHWHRSCWERSARRR